MSASACLAPWACDPARTEHQRDRDRIVHSTAFRRLVYKTQVFINHEGDLFRTRLTHSLEVAQLGRSVARALRLNEDLVEAVALAHDLGHTPFGHAGQDALHACMGPHGGFEHNLQSLRVVDLLEQRYARFDGLNLSHETREGILKHCSRVHALALLANEPDGPAARFVHGGQPSLEAQLVNVVDELAYGAHDVDDGIRAGLITLEQALEVPLLRQCRDAVQAEHPRLGGKRLLHEMLRALLSAQVHDLVSHTSHQLSAAGVATAADVRRSAAPLTALSPALREQTLELKRFLFRELYRHPRVVDMTSRGRQVVTDLFHAYLAEPAEMPAEFADAADAARAVADYVAGMTDRFAQREHLRLTGQRLFD